jgi:hypothetical protein
MALVLVIPALALLLLGQSVRPPAAQAKPTTVLTISQIFCFTLTTNLDWNQDGVINGSDSTQAFLDCRNLTQETIFRRLVRALEGDVDDPEPELFSAPGGDKTAIDVDDGQLHDKDGVFFVVAFVGNDDPVRFYADEGTFYVGGLKATSSVGCGPNPADPMDPSADYQFIDEDCNSDGVRGDGVVVAELRADGADRGPATLTVRQDALAMEEPYVVTGEPWNIELTASKPVIQTGAARCDLFTDTPTFLATLGAAEKTPVTAKVTDSDGTVLTEALVDYESDDTHKAHLALPLVPTLMSGLGIVSPDVVCGGEDSGTVTIRASIAQKIVTETTTIVPNPSARPRHSEAEVKVQGPPTNMVLSASPSSLVCDGTASSTVSATLTDDEGNPAVDGNTVRFDVKALGIASPIEAKSAGGAATAKVTPLSDIAKGVTVKATLLLTEGEEQEADKVAAGPTPTPDIKEISVANIEKSILVECASGPGVTAPEVPAGAAAPAISPPATGDGGYLQGE